MGLIRHIKAIWFTRLEEFENVMELLKLFNDVLDRFIDIVSGKGGREYGRKDEKDRDVFMNGYDRNRKQFVNILY